LLIPEGTAWETILFNVLLGQIEKGQLFKGKPETFKRQESGQETAAIE